MNEKKTIAISVTSLFLVIAIIVIIGMGYFIYRLSQEKQTALEQANQLTTQINTLESTVASLQNTVDSTGNVVSNTSVSTNETITENTSANSSNNLQAIENECRTLLEKYLPIHGSGSPEGLLVNANLLTYEDLNNAEHLPNNYIKTPIQYSDFKNALLVYVTEDYFQSYYGSIDYKSDKKAFINSNGFLAILNAGATGMSFAIQTMQLTSNQNNSVIYEITYTDPDLDMDVSETSRITATFEKATDGSYKISNLDFHN